MCPSPEPDQKTASFAPFTATLFRFASWDPIHCPGWKAKHRNTIVPSKLVIKLETLGLDPALCNWVLDFLTGRPQVVRVCNNISTPLILKGAF